MIGAAGPFRADLWAKTEKNRVKTAKTVESHANVVDFVTCASFRSSETPNNVVRERVLTSFSTTVNTDIDGFDGFMCHG